MAKTNTEVKATNQKVMKAVTPKQAPDFSAIRKIFNTVLTKVKGLTLTENAHGAVQVKDGRGLLFSARSDGAVIITHPMYDKPKGKDRKRVFAIKGGKWDELSQVPFAQVTPEMLIARAEDQKSRAAYHDELYKGRETEAGLFKKSQAAQLRMEKAKKEAGDKKASVKKEAKAVKSVMVDKKEAKRTPVKAIRKAVLAVASKSK